MDRTSRISQGLPQLPISILEYTQERSEVMTAKDLPEQCSGSATCVDHTEEEAELVDMLTELGAQHREEGRRIMTQHTPGPWIAHGKIVYWKDPKDWPGYPPIMCETSISYGQIRPETANANARLIAASPMLLEALKQILGATTVKDSTSMLDKRAVANLCRQAIEDAS
jgi:hypothetical protein